MYSELSDAVYPSVEYIEVPRNTISLDNEHYWYDPKARLTAKMIEMRTAFNQSTQRVDMSCWIGGPKDKQPLRVDRVPAPTFRMLKAA